MLCSVHSVNQFHIFLRLHLRWQNRIVNVCERLSHFYGYSFTWFFFKFILPLFLLKRKCARISKENYSKIKPTRIFSQIGGNIIFLQLWRVSYVSGFFPSWNKARACLYVCLCLYVVRWSVYINQQTCFARKYRKRSTHKFIYIYCICVRANEHVCVRCLCDPKVNWYGCR